MKFYLLLLALFSAPALADNLEARSFLSTPVITVAAYATGDQIGTYTQLDGILGSSSGTIDLKTLVVIDKDKQKADLELLFFNDLPVLASADNAAVSFTDAVASANFIGRVSIAAADYTDTASNSQVTKTLSNTLLTGKGSDDLYVVIVCKAAGGCDYAAVDDLAFRFTYLE